MTLSAQDIQSQQFHVRFRGFDVEEVDDFLEKIAAALQAATDENEKLRSRVEGLEKEVATYHTQEKSFQSAIIAAQSIAEEMKEKSKQEAEQILEAARKEAFGLTDQAHTEVTDLERDLDRLKDLKAQITDELRQKINSYLQMLDNAPLSSTAPAAEDLLQSSMAAAPATFAEQEETTAVAEAPPLEEDDLSDLYVKVDLPDIDLDETAADDEILEPQELELPPMPTNDLLNIDEEDGQAAAIPDLDGDMVFSLEDPLDEDEPAVTFEDLIEKKEKDKFDPNESPL
ncbi:MAG: DivIVA domain-containing protein [Desulfobulbaceae bacterium]|nr:DivIVA domain-containing protein [Desulfobulbaceae bacterium]HIJ79666.1 DivIVA domain-containing protein [Deltaproteobacteria bacterium]